MSCITSHYISLTGDCLNTNSGAFLLEINGAAPPYSVSGASGIFNINVPPSGTTYLETGLSAGTYYYAIIDACASSPVYPYYFNVYISSGTSVNIIDSKNTLCNLDNGSLTARTTYYYNITSFYLYGSGGYVTSGESLTTDFTFNNLSADTYYVIADDGGGCTGKTSNVIIQSSTTLEFEYYVVKDSICSTTSTGGVGKIFITGITGNTPYTYLWSNGETTSSITGLTSGAYTLTVTDSTGCQKIKTIIVDKVDSPGLGSITSVQPSCFLADGEVTIIVTGGTAPFTFSASTGTKKVTLGNTVTFTGLTAGIFYVDIQDGGLCKFSTSTLLTTPNSFNVYKIITTNSNCSNTDGKIEIQINGGASLYTYSITDSSGNTISNTQNSQVQIFDSLSSGTYKITISNITDPCTYTGTTTILNTSKFILSKSTTGTTCNLPNGAVKLNVSGGSGNYLYEIIGPITQSINSALSSYTFNNLISGTYVGSVTDITEKCKQSLNFNISSSNIVNLLLSQTPAIYGNDGKVDAIISSGNAPFILNWSSNVNGQTGLSVTGLTAGTYTLTVIDDDGCTTTRSVVVTGYEKINSTQTYSICNSEFVESGFLIRTAKEMLIEGFYDLTSGETGCILNKAIFYVETIISGETKTMSFYTGTSLNDYPTQTEWGNAVTTLLESYGSVGEVIANVIENSLKIISICDNSFPLLDSNAIVNLKINYDIKCIECAPVTLTPTPTQSVTPTLTPSVTPTLTPSKTPSVTQSMTPTNTPTLSPTNTPTLSPTNTPTLTPSSSQSVSIAAFITTWKTSTPGESITLPYVPVGSTYSGTIDWGDGIITPNDYNQRMHVYASVGTYDVKIYGQVIGWDFGGINSGNRDEIIEIKQWGIPVRNLNNSTLRMFYFCPNLVANNIVDVLDLNGVTATTSMFESCDKITTINNINSWNMTNVLRTDRMFYDCKLFDQSLNSWDVSNVSNMKSMFQKALKFNGNITSWVTSAVTDMSFTFSSAPKFNQNISSWKVYNVKDMSGTFQGAGDFNQNIGIWNVSGVTNMSATFNGAISFDQDLNNWNVSNVTNMFNMFNNAKVFNRNLNLWNVSNVTNMSGMFAQTPIFNGDITNWNVSNVKNMEKMFNTTGAFNQNISSWVTSAVTDMSEMFSNSIFNQNISLWDTSAVIDMSQMFSFSIFNQNIGSWSVYNVKNMSGMFLSAGTFNQNIGSWNVSGVTDMSRMFSQAKNYNQNMNSWNVSGVTNMSFMFFSAISFNQNIGLWNVSKVKNMDSMFLLAEKFNQNIGLWNVSAVTDMYRMFQGAVLFNQDLSSWNISSVTQKISFCDQTPAWTLPKPPFSPPIFCAP